ncbi:putative non-specific serine/threonine protein kinase [Helianthus annuus]|nr:putative non-specific serine/threonine protein kinase [Helianthus annuus]
MEFCPRGDLHTLRQRQPEKHFTEQAVKRNLIIWKLSIFCWHSELQKFREAAIEDAKRQWNLKNKDARSLSELHSLDEKNDI